MTNDYYEEESTMGYGFENSGIKDAGLNEADITNFLLELPKDDNVIYAQHDRWNRAVAGHKAWAEMAIKCQKFLEGDQWTDEEKAILKSQGRPSVTLNKIKPLVFLISGFYRQNRYDDKVLPTSNSASIESIAEMLTLQLKQIGEANNAEWKDAQVFQDGLVTGRGYWDTRMDFSKNQIGEVRISHKDPFSILIDPEAESFNPTEQDGGWGFIFENRWLSAAEIFMLYGANITSTVVNQEGINSIQANNYMATDDYDMPKKGFGLELLGSDWRISESTSNSNSNIANHLDKNRNLIRVLDCQHVALKMVDYLYDTETGEEYIIDSSMDKAKLSRILEFAQIAGLNIQAGRAVRKMVRWTITAANRILYDEWSPYQDSFTITPFFPYFRRGVTRGLIHDLLDPQMEINRRRSSRLHILMASANNGWMFERGALDDENKRNIEEMGSTPGLKIEYEAGKPAPQRIDPAPSPNALKEAEFDSTADLKEIANINDSALGNIDRVQSGKAILARQKQSLIGTEVYFDNFRYSRELKANLTITIVQLYYTEQRIIRLRDDNGNPTEYKVNEQAANEIKNNLSIGRYGVVVEQVPATATFMESQFQDLMELLERGIPIPPDILIRHSSVGGKQEIIKRIEEQNSIQTNIALMENIMQRLQAGIPLDQPLPPIVINGQELPSVVTPEILQQVMGSLQSMKTGGGMGMAGKPQQPLPPQQQSQQSIAAQEGEI